MIAAAKPRLLDRQEFAAAHRIEQHLRIYSAFFHVVNFLRLIHNLQVTSGRVFSYVLNHPLCSFLVENRAEAKRALLLLSSHTSRPPNFLPSSTQLSPSTSQHGFNSFPLARVNGSRFILRGPLNC